MDILWSPYRDRKAQYGGSRKRSRARRAVENRVAMAKSRDRIKADSAVRKIGDDLPGRIEDSVTLRWKAPPIVGAAVSSRGLWTSDLGDLRRFRGREAQRPVRSRIEGGDRGVRGSVLRVVTGKRTSRWRLKRKEAIARPAEADFRCREPPSPPNRTLGRKSQTDRAETHEVRVLVDE